MATFRARDRSSAVLRSPRSEVWAALTDADLIAQMTPYVTSIDVDGDRWTWRMGTIPVLHVSVAATTDAAGSGAGPGREDLGEYVEGTWAL